MFFQIFVDGPDKAGPVIDESGIDFKKRCAGVEKLQGLSRRHDAAHTHNGKTALGMVVDVPHERQGFLV